MLTEAQAAAVLDGPWDRGGLAERLADVIGPVPAEDLAVRLLGLSPTAPPGGAPSLVRLVGDLALETPPEEPRWRGEVPRWETTGDLARALGLDVGELAWFADARAWNRRAGEPLRHYRTWWVPSRSHGRRLIESPKPRLAELQRRLVRHLLDRFDVHDAAHGFRKGRSTTTFAAPHAGKPLVVRLDLEGFFTSVTGARLRGLLTAHGYPITVATALTGLLTTRTPPEALHPADWPQRRRLAAPHLPQGAPSSPATANVIARALDRRLAGLARTLGATYTRYADDLAFSGDDDLPLHRLLPGVRGVVEDEGFRLNPRKTRIAAAHQRQRLAGLVVNDTPAASRAEYDDLKAVLHNCARHGLESQNRHHHPDFRAHLRGRVEWVSAGRPARRARLTALLDAISG
ncbi:reverse transcriptase family protein [Saccharothrix variisporea]|uniref:RNA-directed DNA polymerase n=1 Tax=Saccharothrix variisporea TaxID=543527 RepID=A0A495XG98_9PSEU|nr:reverse transcriptase family protein [Saccharothrix variisporea]RKT72236.1 RNA-directed DNA polymerase [Saccharothrix variisporea]